MDNLEVYNPESIAQSVIPYSYEDNRARYLGLRASGFTPRESIRLIGISSQALSNWRRDPEFVSLEARLPELQQRLSRDYARLEFLRVYRLVARKDAEVIEKSLEKDEEGNAVPLSKQDHDYLLKMRTYYTPQQLQALEVLISGEAQDNFNFTEVVKELGRTGRLKVRAQRDQVEFTQDDTPNYREITSSRETEH